MKNKIIVILSVLVIIFAFSSCADDTEVTTEPNEEATASEMTTEEAVAEETSEETTAEDVTEETTEETSEETTAEETTEEAAVPEKNASLTVEQVEDIAGEPGTVFNATADEYAFYAVFKSDVEITDVKVLGLTFLDADEDGNIKFDREVLHTVQKIGPDFNLSVHLTADGSIPAYGISYVDTDGTEKAFSVNMSGEDSSLYLSAIN